MCVYTSVLPVTGLQYYLQCAAGVSVLLAVTVTLGISTRAFVAAVCEHLDTRAYSNTRLLCLDTRAHVITVLFAWT